jgi:hypothetical protein
VKVIGWRVRIGAMVVLGAALAAVAVLLLSSNGSSAADPPSDAGHALAARETADLLSGLALPRGATPAEATQSELSALGRAVAADVVQRSRAWTVPEPVAAVHAFLAAHPARGTVAVGGDLTRAPRPLPRGIAAASVQVTLVATGPRTTVVHAAAQARWIVARAASERVPVNARELDITRGRPGRRPGIVLHLTSPARVARIASLLDRLATVQPGAVYHCPAAVPGLATVTFTFRARRGGPALAQASEDADDIVPTTACDPLSFVIAGHAQTPLLGGATLLRQVSRLLGRRLWLAPYAA